MGEIEAWILQLLKKQKTEKTYLFNSHKPVMSASFRYCRFVTKYSVFSLHVHACSLYRRILAPMKTNVLCNEFNIAYLPSILSA